MGEKSRSLGSTSISEPLYRKKPIHFDLFRHQKERKQVIKQVSKIAFTLIQSQRNRPMRDLASPQAKVSHHIEGRNRKEIVVSNECNDFYFSVDLFDDISLGFCVCGVASKLLPFFYRFSHLLWKSIFPCRLFIVTPSQSCVVVVFLFFLYICFFPLCFFLSCFCNSTIAKRSVSV